MTVETNANFLSELNETFPRKGDLIKEGDDHMRLIKHCLKTTLPGFSSAVKMTSDTLNLFNTNITMKADRMDVNVNVYAAANKTWDFANNRLQRVGAPTQPTDAVNREYLEKNAGIGAWPIGSVFMTTKNQNPNQLLGFGGWTPTAQGRCLVGAGTGTDDRGEQRPFGAGERRGEYSHLLTTNEMPNHSHGHNFSGFAQNSGNHRHAMKMHDYRMSIHDKHCRVFVTGRAEVTEWTEYEGVHSHNVTISGSISGNGGNATHNNVQPYLVVYIWERTS